MSLVHNKRHIFLSETILGQIIFTSLLNSGLADPLFLGNEGLTKKKKEDIFRDIFVFQYIQVL